MYYKSLLRHSTFVINIVDHFILIIFSTVDQVLNLCSYFLLS